MIVSETSSVKFLVTRFWSQDRLSPGFPFVVVYVFYEDFKFFFPVSPLLLSTELTPVCRSTSVTVGLRTPRRMGPAPEKEN